MIFPLGDVHADDFLTTPTCLNRTNNPDKYTREMSADGKHELVMGTNYFGHCILNESLMDLVDAAGEELKASGEYARIIVVSSVVAFLYTDLDRLKDFDLEGEQAVKNGKYDVHRQYTLSNHAQVSMVTITRKLFLFNVDFSLYLVTLYFFYRSCTHGSWLEN